MMTKRQELETITALLMQPLGRDGAIIYRVYWQDENGRERNYTTDSDEFWQIHDAAGQPSYTEPGYWTYEVTK